MIRVPQTSNTQYFRQAMGTYLSEAKGAPLPPVHAAKDGSLGFLMTERHLGGVGDPLAHMAKRPGKGPVPISGISKLLVGSPILNAAKAMKGLGEDTPSEDVLPPETFIEKTTRQAGGGLAVGVAALQLAVAGICSYQIGKAVAPSAAKQKKYAFWAVPIGLLAPYFGLGAMSIYALNKKR